MRRMTYTDILQTFSVEKLPTLIENVSFGKNDAHIVNVYICICRGIRVYRGKYTTAG